MGNLYKEQIRLGKTSQEATDIVNEQFGTNISLNTMCIYGSNYLKTLSADPKVSTPKQAEPSRHDMRIRSIAKEVFKEMMSTIPAALPTTAYDPSDMPPQPETIRGQGKGRRQNRSYRKFSITMDSVLWNLFVEEYTARKIPPSQLLDAVMWRHYGKPRLSYESQDHQD
jgi:hypothetical protein